MKKLFGIIIIAVIIGFAGYFIYVNYLSDIIPKIDVEEEKANVDEYFIYGNHLNIKGNLKLDNVDFDNCSLVLYNGEEREYDVKVDKNVDSINFNTSEYLNEGMFIDDLDRGIYYLFLKFDYKEDDDNIISKYYVLDNKTDYDSALYYTLSKYGNKINISRDEDYGTFFFEVSKNIDSEDFDITIDPGHGGMDSGALAGNYKESDFAMNISMKLKSYLEDAGYSVKITHDKDELSSDKVMDEYNKHGRAVISNEVKSKYTFSIHINKNVSSNVKGIEIYTADLINYDFAKSIAKNIVDKTDFGYSTNRMYKVSDGVYTHNFTESEIQSSLAGYEKKGYNPYNVTTKSNYLFMIRETGGYMTGAYVDDSNPEKVGINPYYNSNVGNESYLLELGYMSNANDLNILLKDDGSLARAIGECISSELANNS